MKRLSLLLLCTVLAIIISGCIGGAKYSTTAGAEITEFSFDVSEIEDYEDDVVLTLSFENIGAKTMEGNTGVYVYGPSFATGQWKVVSGGTVKNNRLEWGLSAIDFYPPDPDTGQRGMAEIYNVVLEPPNLAENEENDYNFYARLCYPYRTSTISVIELIGRNEYRSSAISKTEAETRNSVGPIQLALQVGQTIRVRSSGDTTELPLVFEVTDVGGGFATKSDIACDPNVERENRNKIQVSVTIDGDPIDCSNEGVVLLRDGKGDLYCTETFDNPNPKSEYHIETTSVYNYYIDGSTSIHVKDSFYD